MKKTTLRKNLFYLTATAVMVAMGTALSFVTVQIPLGGVIIKQFSVWLVTVYLVSIICGPLYGMAAGFLCDLFSTLLNPAGGGYNPFFAAAHIIAPVVIWLIYAVVFKKVKSIFIKIPVTVAVTQALIYLPINTFLIWYFYSSKGFFELLATRSLSLIIEIPVFTLLLFALVPLSEKLMEKITKTR